MAELNGRTPSTGGTPPRPDGGCGSRGKDVRLAGEGGNAAGSGQTDPSLPSRRSRGAHPCWAAIPERHHRRSAHTEPWRPYHRAMEMNSDLHVDVGTDGM